MEQIERIFTLDRFQLAQRYAGLLRRTGFPVPALRIAPFQNQFLILETQYALNWKYASVKGTLPTMHPSGMPLPVRCEINLNLIFFEKEPVSDATDGLGNRQSQVVNSNALPQVSR